MKKKATRDYNYIMVPDEKGSNVVYINHAGKKHLKINFFWFFSLLDLNGNEKETILMAANLPKSAAIIKSEADGATVVELDNSELAKVDGCLTCCSVLF